MRKWRVGTVRRGLKPHGCAIIKNPVETGCAVNNLIDPPAPFMGVCKEEKMRIPPDPEKRRYRKMMQERLQAMTTEEFQVRNREVRSRFSGLQPVKTAATVMIYYSIHREVETISLIEELFRAGKRVALPVCAPKCNLIAKEIRDLSEVQKSGRYGLSEPVSGTPEIESAALDLIVLPGLAFDRSGNRLGHGAGYYDRFLSRAPQSLYKLGLAYGFQVVERLPAQQHDIKINGLLTPDGFFEFSQPST
jgi:5-formyltetrahydrofolate cyclo-ligase